MYRCDRRRGFSVIEVIVALTILGIGLVGMIQLFPVGLESSRRAENETRAAILAQEILEGLKADPLSLPVIPGSVELVPLPGNGIDDERVNYSSSEAAGLLASIDRNSNGRLDIDFDGGLLDRFSGGDQTERDPDGLIDRRHSTPDYNYDGMPGIYQGDANGDGDPFYDPEYYAGRGIDEEYPDGKDNDGDGEVDEDCNLAVNYLTGSIGLFPEPLSSGDGLDNDGDGEEGSPAVDIRRYSFPPNPASPYQWVNVSVADGNDNNNDGRIDEGIDEELFDGLDNDGDGMVDEDCRLASYPFVPRRFPPLVQAVEGQPQDLFAHPNEQFSWQFLVGRVSDGGGDGFDNDGDGLIDEDPRDGIDNDLDGRVDEDPSPMPLPGYRKVIIRITWGGDREDNDGDGGDTLQTERIDEERIDGLDDDFDGLIDEDTYTNSYELTGFVLLQSAGS